MQKLTVTLYTAATLLVVVAIPLQRNVRDATSTSTYSCTSPSEMEVAILGTDPSNYEHDHSLEDSKLSVRKRTHRRRRRLLSFFFQ